MRERLFYTVVPHRPVLYATLAAVSRRASCGVVRADCCRPALLGLVHGRAAAARAAWRSGSHGVSGRRLPGLLSAGTVPDPGRSIRRLIVCAASGLRFAASARAVRPQTADERAGRHPDVQRARQPSAAWSAACSRIDGFRLLVVDDGSPDGTGQIADALARGVSRARRGHAPHRPARARASYVDGLRHALEATDADLICQMDADCRTIRSTCRRSSAAARDARPRDRLALPERRQRRELAAPPDHAERVRESLHPRRSPARRPATARAATAAGGARRSRGCRSIRWCRTATRSSSRCCTRRTRRGCRIGEVPIIFVERRHGQSKLSCERARRVG